MCFLNHPPSEEMSEQAKNGFHGHPRGDGSLGSVSRGRKPPASHGLYGALVKSKPDAFDYADGMRPAIFADKNLQRHRTLHFAVPRIVGIRRIRTIRASGRNESGPIRSTP